MGTGMYHQVSPNWQEGPRAPALANGRVDVWRIELDTQPCASAANLAGASAGDKPSTRRRAAAHAAMYDILLRYLGRAADAFAFGVRTGGKPYLDIPDCPIEFNLSHSQDLALLAVTRGASVGIDMEQQRPIDDPLRLARRALPAADAAELASLPDDDRRVQRFLDLWTRMEARQKAVGRGIFGGAADPLQMSCVTFRPCTTGFASLSVMPRQARLVLRFFRYHRP